MRSRRFTKKREAEHQPEVAVGERFLEEIQDLHVIFKGGSSKQDVDLQSGKINGRPWSNSHQEI